ncbi:secreted RxLR effector peptide protein, putative [Phytophthora infestans T30-4]|uniref:RxLR effector protein n=2 Tax=Phytophthora infestans TaxID=4787 RepID=D0NGS4_PHYIT|nr:secreted RxLR effector peptide protein, putative [Phytophthora infestans T30-4]EEY58563.1 secreted RxLR effector peptide protein, putative [Phytophthora infestans T30-4]KAF4037357.1 hypothetical protein GN244_ATG10585 [Phytophthora infestans]KAF4127561.1 hypothetical protein GN958_ATG23236 [Phytophthora infestans]|eukprot:XP_002901507.1 secreted RxLR effector peptide protein, putative [Phytophthora infestans T30-4]
MRFFYVALAVAATLLASTDATPTDSQQKSNLRKSVIAKVGVDAKRSLRSSEEEPAAPLVGLEERGGGLNSDKLWKLVKSHEAIPVEIAKLSDNVQEKIAGVLMAQNLSLEKFAKKVGMDGAHDTAHRNNPFFQKWKANFLDGKKPKKIPEEWI